MCSLVNRLMSGDRLISNEYFSMYHIKIVHKIWDSILKIWDSAFIFKTGTGGYGPTTLNHELPPILDCFISRPTRFEAPWLSGVRKWNTTHKAPSDLSDQQSQTV